MAFKEMKGNKKMLMRERTRCIPKLIQPALTGGMAYVIQLADESFVVMDGGDHCETDVENLYALLRSKVSDEKKPVIQAWMFTHPHSDHIGLATDFLKRYAKEVDVHAFVYQFPDCKKLNTWEDDSAIENEIENLKRSMNENYPSAQHDTLHTGQTYHFDGAKIEILFDMQDLYPYTPNHYNDVSAAWRVIFENKKTFLVLGDCFTESCKKMADTYGEYLKSDVMQVTHHGLIGGDQKLYQLVDPDICFWPISKERFEGIEPEGTPRYCLGEGGCDYNRWIRDDRVRKRKHYHGSETITLEMNDI